jgi:hypothetical protein
MNLNGLKERESKKKLLVLMNRSYDGESDDKLQAKQVIGSGIEAHNFVCVCVADMGTSLKSLQFLPYGRSIGSWICLTHKTYTCHTVQNTIRYDLRFTGMKVRYTIFERVTMYNNAKRSLRKLQWFISTVILL